MPYGMNPWARATSPVARQGIGALSNQGGPIGQAPYVMQPQTLPQQPTVGNRFAQMRQRRQARAQQAQAQQGAFGGALNPPGPSPFTPIAGGGGPIGQAPYVMGSQPALPGGGAVGLNAPPVMAPSINPWLRRLMQTQGGGGLFGGGPGSTPGFQATTGPMQQVQTNFNPWQRRGGYGSNYPGMRQF